MKQDKEQTIVKFLMGSGKDLMAYFPDILYADNRDYRVAYSHVGQHSACSPAYANECRYAKKKEYKNLQKELEQIGYNLKIINEEL